MARLVRAVREFEDAGDVRQVMGQIAPRFGALVSLEIVVVGEGERLGGGDVGERTLLLPRRGRDGIDRLGIQRDGERPSPVLAWGDVVQLHELLAFIAAPDAELAGGKPAADVEGHLLRRAGALGFGDDAVIRAR